MLGGEGRSGEAPKSERQKLKLGDTLCVCVCVCE